MGGCGSELISDKPLQFLDPDTIIQNSPVAGILTEFKTNPAQDRRKRLFPLEVPVGFFIFFVIEQLHPAFDIITSRAGVLARRNLVFIDWLDETPTAGFIVKHISQGNMHRGYVAIRFELVFYPHLTAFFRRHKLSSFPLADPCKTDVSFFRKPVKLSPPDYMPLPPPAGSAPFLPVHKLQWPAEWH